MFKYIICLNLFTAAVIMYNQNDYNVVWERLEIISYNKEHISFAKSYNSKYNRTHFGSTLTLNFETDFGRKLQVEVQAFRFASNEYRLFPMTFGLNLCSTLASNDFGIQNLYRCGNFTKCPMKKGHYVICNWAPDQSKFPPYIPHGNYRSDIKFFYLSTEIAHLQAYLASKEKDLIIN